MPYADPEKARAYARAAMARLRLRRGERPPPDADEMISVLERLAAAGELDRSRRLRLSEILSVAENVIDRQQVEMGKVDIHTVTHRQADGSEIPVNERLTRKMAQELAQKLANRQAPDTGFDEPIELEELPEAERPEPGKTYRVLAGFHRYDAWLWAKGLRDRGMPDFHRLVCRIHVGATPGHLQAVRDANPEPWTPGRKRKAAEANVTPA